MDKYISLKVVEAEPMTLNEFRFTFERDPAPGKDGSTEGYMIHYRDGYTSRCPKETFEADYQKIS